MLNRLVNLTKSDAVKIRRRQIRGSMKEHYDEELYLCYDTTELEMWKPNKVGRKAIRRDL